MFVRYTQSSLITLQGKTLACEEAILAYQELPRVDRLQLAMLTEEQAIEVIYAVYFGYLS